MVLLGGQFVPHGGHERESSGAARTGGDERAAALRLGEGCHEGGQTGVLMFEAAAVYARIPDVHVARVNPDPNSQPARRNTP